MYSASPYKESRSHVHFVQCNIFSLPDSRVKCEGVNTFQNFLQCLSVGFICNYLLYHKCLQMHLQHPVQQCQTGGHTRHRMFLMKWEVNLYFATPTYFTPHPVLHLHFLLIHHYIQLSFSLSLITWVREVSSCIYDHCQKHFNYRHYIQQYFHRLKLHSKLAFVQAP
jgi:hypothetical protein